MKKVKCLKKAFGVNEWGLVDYPTKTSNVKIERVRYRGCPWCFPHGYETTNSTINNRQKNWKKFRKTRWK
jgi:hypothetical protein